MVLRAAQRSQGHPPAQAEARLSVRWAVNQAMAAAGLGGPALGGAGVLDSSSLLSEEGFSDMRDWAGRVVIFRQQVGKG